LKYTQSVSTQRLKDFLEINNKNASLNEISYLTEYLNHPTDTVNLVGITRVNASGLPECYESISTEPVQEMFIIIATYINRIKITTLIVFSFALISLIYGRYFFWQKKKVSE
jgi:hypothetical protein